LPNPTEPTSIECQLDIVLYRIDITAANELSVPKAVTVAGTKPRIASAARGRNQLKKPLAESQRPWRGRWPQPKSPSLFREAHYLGNWGEGFELGTRVSPSPSPSPQSCHHSAG